VNTRKELHALQDRLLQEREAGTPFAELARSEGRDEEQVRHMIQSARARRSMRARRKQQPTTPAQERLRANESPELRADRLTRGFLTRAERDFAGKPFACPEIIREHELAAMKAAA